MIFPKQFFVGHRFFFQHCLRNHKNSFTLQELTKICNQQLIYITKGNQLSCHAVLTSNLSESHSHAPSVGLHGHQLQFFVCLGRSSKSFNDQMRRDDLTSAEQHGKHGPFLHETTHGNTADVSLLRATCHLQQNSGWWNAWKSSKMAVKYMWNCEMEMLNSDEKWAFKEIAVSFQLKLFST